MADKYTNLGSFIGQELPPEILNQLKIDSRIKFELKKTTASNVSTAGDDNSTGVSPTRDNNAEIDRLVNSVDELEKLVEQLEDMANELTKDMNIPPANKTVSEAAKQLGSPDGFINKKIFDNALSMMDYFIPLTTGQDPILGALTGDGELNGKWLNCDELTKELGKNLTVAVKTGKKPEETIENQYDKITDLFNKKQQNIALELILMLWWNIIWPKFVVDLNIIEPLRRMYAFPFDNLVLFFKDLKSKCGPKARWFRKKSKTCVEENGPINKALTRFRNFLLCVVPPIFYPRYKPKFPYSKQPDCKKKYNCTPEQDKPEITVKDNILVQMLASAMEHLSDEPCTTVEEFTKDIDKTKPTGLGINPDCLNAGKIILDAVLNDALHPKNTSKNVSGDSDPTQIIKNSNKQ